MDTQKDDSKPKVDYDVKSILFPRVTGLKLDVFSRLLHFPIIGNSITQHLMKSNGLNTVQEFADTLNQVPPTSFPILRNYQYNHSKEDKENRELFQLKAYSIPPEPSSSNSSCFHHWTISDYISRYMTPRSSFTPIKAAERILTILSETNPSKKNHFFISFRAEEIMTQAQASAERYKSKTTLGPLDGIPIAVKDECNVKGYPTTKGTSFIKSVATYDDSYIIKLKQMGVIIIGKTNMHEIGIGTTGHNPHYGTPTNPYGKSAQSSHNSYYTGGSSSGSAAAVASGLVPIAIGADGGGSVRVPASLCGVFGIKPTFGRIDHLSDACASVHHVGVFGVCMRDISLVYAIMASPFTSSDGVAEKNERDWRKNTLPPIFKPVYVPKTSSLSSLRIGIYPEYFNDADAAVVKACQRAVDFLGISNSTDGGPVIKEIAIPHLQIQRLAHAIIITSEMATFMSRYADKYSEIAADTRCNLAIGLNVTAQHLISAQKVRTFAIQIINEIFEEVDVVLTPTVPMTAPPFLSDAKLYGENNVSLTTALMRFVTLGNLVGLPAISVPVGYDENGLPIGLQIMGRWWDEDVVMRVASFLEKGWMEGKWEKPSEYYDILKKDNKDIQDA